MPLSRDKPYVYVDGKKEDVSGASMLAPEWNQEDLVQGEKVVCLTAHHRQSKLVNRGILKYGRRILAAAVTPYVTAVSDHNWAG